MRTLPWQKEKVEEVKVERHFHIGLGPPVISPCTYTLDKLVSTAKTLEKFQQQLRAYQVLGYEVSTIESCEPHGCTCELKEERFTLPSEMHKKFSSFVAS